jgi:hypothetical protein
MATTAEQVQQLYIGLLGRAADKEGLDYWVDEIDGGTLTLEQLRANIVNEQPEYINGLGSLTRIQLVNALYLNMFEREAGQEGLDYWVTGEGAGVNADQLVLALIDGAQTDDRLVLDNKTEAAEFYTANQGTSAYTASGATAAVADVDGTPESVVASKSVSGAAGNVTFMLTGERDFLTGTADGDTFFGLAGQSPSGQIANALSTGDLLDGGAGRDRLIASLVNDENANGDDDDEYVRPITSNIEEVYIEAIDDDNGEVYLNATRMSNVEQFWSDFSDEDLEIENINLNGDNLNITKDVTFGLRDTREDAGLVATFDSQSLLAAPEFASNSQLLIEVADVSTLTPATPLANVNLTLGFDLGDDSFILEDVQSTDGTYAGLVTAIEAALAAEGLSELTVATGDSYTSVTVAGNTVLLPFTAQEILITDPDGNEFGEVDFTPSSIDPVPGGFLVAGTADAVDPSVTSNLIETNLVLDNAGRGSIGGDVQIGGQSDTFVGVERFNVTVDRSSAISFLGESGSNDNQLDEIYIGSMGANGDLYIGSVESNLDLINATMFEGSELEIGDGESIQGLFAFNSAGSSANVTLDWNYNGDIFASSRQAATINTGSGDDVIDANITGNSTSGSTDASLTLTSSGGDNTIRLTSDATEETSATVTLGGGDDFVRGEETFLTASTGAGNDVIFTEDTGASATATLLNGASNFTADTGAGTAAAVNGSQTLFGRTVQVTVAMPEELAGVVSADSFADGFEVTASITASRGFVTTERDLYEAAASAINSDPIVSELVTATVDSNGILRVSYIVDGATLAGDELVQIEVLGDWADLSPVEQDNVVAGLRTAYSDSTIAEPDVEALYDNGLNLEDFAVATTNGSDSATVGENTVNAGMGNDVIVLSSNDATVDTVEFSAGGFGSDTIVHYDDVAGGDVLDFSAWLDNVTSASGSIVTQARIAGDFVDLTAAPGAIGANFVAVTELEEIDGSTAATVAFATLTDSQVLEALNTGFTQSAAPADFVGNVQKSILMVENSNGGSAADNLGEYKVYEVSYSISAAEFTSARLVGTTDFSDSLDVAAMDATNIA